jgi:TetR/AcrR family transcriptional regulator, transcriptional repressor for nem operon
MPILMRKSKADLSRERILTGAQDLILARGFSAMTVDAICQSAGITKGGFFHHFPNKEALGEAVLAKFWNDAEERQIAAAYRNEADPVKYLEGYLDHAIEAYKDPELQKGCMLAIFTMELAESNEALFKSASQHFENWRTEFMAMLKRAFAFKQPSIDAQSWGDLYISTLEGSLLLAKAKNDPMAITRSLTLYKELLLRALTNQ